MRKLDLPEPVLRRELCRLRGEPPFRVDVRARVLERLPAMVPRSLVPIHELAWAAALGLVAATTLGYLALQRLPDLAAAAGQLAALRPAFAAAARAAGALLGAAVQAVASLAASAAGLAVLVPPAAPWLFAAGLLCAATMLGTIGTVLLRDLRHGPL